MMGESPSLTADQAPRFSRGLWIEIWGAGQTDSHHEHQEHGATGALGLLLMLILLTVGGEALKIVPTEAGAVYAVVSLTLHAVACVVAGYFLRTFWALLIVPIVFWGGAILFGFLTIYTNLEDYWFEALFVLNVFVVVVTIPI